MTDTSKTPEPNFVVSVAAGCVVACLATLIAHGIAWVVWRVNYAAEVQMPMPQTDPVVWLSYVMEGVLAGAWAVIGVAAGLMLVCMVVWALASAGRWAILATKAVGSRKAATQTPSSDSLDAGANDG